MSIIAGIEKSYKSQYRNNNNLNKIKEITDT